MMRIIRRLKALAALLLKLGVAIVAIGGFTLYALSEIGPEVVTVETFSSDGTRLSTRLWIVDAEGRSWLRAGPPWGAEWLHRLETQSRVVVHRVTGVREFDAVPVREPEAIERIQALMRAKYGMRDLLVSLAGLVSDTVPIRLDPVPVDPGVGDGVAAEAPDEGSTSGPSAARWRARSLDKREAKGR